MNSNQNYLNPKKTIGYLTVSKKTPIYKKTPTKKNNQAHYSNTISKNINNEINNSNINSGYNFLTKYISKKKFQGILDTTSPGNKDVLIDSDSELPPTKKTENNNIFKNNKCAKLVIDKVESQVPRKNGDYYRAFHPLRISGKTKTSTIFKKNYINKNALLRNAYIKQSNTDHKNYNDIDNYHLLSQTQVEKIGYVQPFSNYQGFINASVQRKKQNSSMKNIHNNNGYNYSNNKKFYNTGFTYSSQSGSNILKNKDNTLITKSPADYIRSIEDSSINVNVRDNIYKIYENDNESGVNPYIQESIYPDKKNDTRFYYIHKNKYNNIVRNRNISEESKKSTLYENYKDLIKLNTFSKLNNKKVTSKFILYPGFKEKLIKIQSVWRGAYVRELMSFYWNLTDFKDILNKVINNHIHDYLLDFINALSIYKIMKKKNILNNIQIKFKAKKQKYLNEKENIEEYKRALYQKEEDYDNLLKNYNSLVERCTNLQQVINQMNGNENKKENLIKNKNFIKKELDLDRNNNPYEKKVNNLDILKKFDIIQPEQKDNFNINQTNNKIFIIDGNNPNPIENADNNNVNLRGRKLVKKINSVERQATIQYKYKKPDVNLNMEHDKKKLNIINIKPKKGFNEVNVIQKIESIQLIKIKPIKEQNIIEKQKEIKFEHIKINKETNNINLIEKKDSFQYKNDTNNTFKKYYEYFSRNLNSINAEQFFVSQTANKTKKNVIEIFHNELSLINNKTKIEEICKTEDLMISRMEKGVTPLILEINNIEPINLICAKQQKFLIREIYKNDSINLIKTKKPILIEVFKNESISLIKEPKKQISIFDNNLLNRDNIIELSIVNNIDINKNKIYELVPEKQINSNIEIKSLKKEEIFKEYIIDKLNNDIHIEGKNKENKFNDELMNINNDIKITITNENKKEFLLYRDNTIILSIKNKNLSNNKNKSNSIYENERFTLSDGKIINLIKEKRDDIKLESNQTKNKNYNIEFIITNNNNLFINKIKKNTSDKITEITEEINKIEPNNHYELIFEGIINLNEDLKDKEKKENINNCNILENKKDELYSQNNNENNESKENKNYNTNNEIFKGDIMEINPYELKRTKNNSNNIFISHENKLEVLNDKESIFTEKAKENMMKIILPIRLKTTLREFVRRNILPLLISKLKKIAKVSLLNKFNKFESENDDKCDLKIINIFNKYAIYKWNRMLYGISKEIIDNKEAIFEKIRK